MIKLSNETLYQGLVGEFYHRNYSLLTRIAQPGGIIKQRSIAEAKVATITLIILLAVIAYGLFRTGRSTTASQTTPGGTSAQAEQGSVIDQTPLDTARRLVQMPTSADELPLADTSSHSEQAETLSAN